MSNTTLETNAASNDRLSFTLFLALALHAMLVFGCSFTADKGNKVAPTLNITLATHSAKVAPEKADFLAQHNQEASGTLKTTKELTTTQAAEIADVNIREINPTPQQKAVQKSEQNRELIHTQREQQRKIAMVTTPTNRDHQQEREGQDADTPLLSPEAASLKAKLDKIKEDRAKEPRIRRLTSVATKASEDAEYLNRWAEKVEGIGNKHFPKEAIDRGIFGSLGLVVTIRPDGSVENIEISQPSGHSLLDDAALQIVKLSAPFAPFPPEMRKKVDRLEIIRTWRFEITGLTTSK